MTQGELIGTLNLGPRLSEQDYSTDDNRLLATLAAQAAPAIRVAQLVREQAAEAAERERFEQELKVAQLIQQQFLPRELPNLPEWEIAGVLPAGARGRRRLLRLHRACRRPHRCRRRRRHRQGRAGRARHGPHALDPPGRAPRLVEPGEVLARANELLSPEMPAQMFVTCLYRVLEPATGQVVFANAGHNLPYVRTADGVIELRATGLPLGLMPDIVYEETEGSRARRGVLLYSDGLVEAARTGPRDVRLPAPGETMGGATPAASSWTGCSRLSLHGPRLEQEDDITLVTLRRFAGASLCLDRRTPGGPRHP